MHNMRTLTEAINSARKDGFVEDFQAEEAGLKCLRTGDVFKAADVAIVRHERFEGHSYEDDEEALYGIETNNGLKGLLVDAYGTYASEHVANFICNVRVDENR